MPFEDCLRRLEAKIPDYIKSVGSFQYENETCTCTGIYDAAIMQKCQACGHYPIREVFVVTNTKGESFNVGNVCINRITNQKISQWYKTYRRKRANLEKNKHIIEKLSNINTPEANQIQARLCHGFNPTKKQRKYLNDLLGH